MAKADLTAQRLRELLHYDPETGVFTWRKFRAWNAVKGQALTSLNKDGYLHANIFGVPTPLHRLAWLYVTGEWSEHDLDHKNLIKTDNRWVNIRPATKSQNNKNVGLTVRNKSGYKGVSRCGTRWRAQCRVDGKNHAIGYFANPEDASLAYQKFASQNHGEFFRA